MKLILALPLLAVSSHAWTFTWRDADGKATTEKGTGPSKCISVDHAKGEVFDAESQGETDIDMYFFATHDCSGENIGHATDNFTKAASKDILGFQVFKLGDEPGSSSDSGSSTESSTKTSTKSGSSPMTPVSSPSATTTESKTGSSTSKETETPTKTGGGGPETPAVSTTPSGAANSTTPSSTPSPTGAAGQVVPAGGLALGLVLGAMALL